jgi:hypothetical protein
LETPLTPIFHLRLKIFLLKNFSGKNTIKNNDPVTYLRQNFSQFSSSIKLNNTTTYEIGKIIHSLKRMDSYGYDEISSRILKIGAPYVLSPYRTYLIKFYQQVYSLKDSNFWK